MTNNMPKTIWVTNFREISGSSFGKLPPGVSEAQYTNTQMLIEELEEARKSYSMRDVSQEYNEGANAMLDTIIERLRDEN